jgi:hypothetical protein
VKDEKDGLILKQNKWRMRVMEKVKEGRNYHDCIRLSFARKVSVGKDHMMQMPS